MSSTTALLRVLLTIAVCVPLAAGCSLLRKKREPKYSTIVASPDQDTQLAIEENQRAVELIERGKLERAEKVLQTALVSDVTFAPAHNNLGQVYFTQRKFYLAAWEFEYASKLMPDRPEPLSNLGMVYEAVGRFEEAVMWYSMAYSMAPRNPEIIGNLARARMRNGDWDGEVHHLLRELLMYDTRPGWVCWAREKLNVLPLPSDAEQIRVPPVPTEELPPLPQEARATDGVFGPLFRLNGPGAMANRVE